MTFRKPNSNMSAVEVVHAMYDGKIPEEALATARAEDAAYVAPADHTLPGYAKVEESRALVAYYADKVHRLIKAKRDCDANGTTNYLWSASTVAMWFREWRKARRALKRAQSEFTRLNKHFPSHDEMLADFAAGLREHNARAA